MSDEPRDDMNDNDLPSAGDLLRWAEKTQRTIDFILQQQAQAQARAEADTERLREMREDNEARWARADERWENSERRWERIERMWEHTEESVRSLHAIAQIHEGEIATLAETQARTDAQLAETGERVNALVNTVERLISERRNGGCGEEKAE
jgi:transcriptional regulator with XRE-family HTH domain